MIKHGRCVRNFWQSKILEKHVLMWKYGRYRVDRERFRFRNINKVSFPVWDHSQKRLKINCKCQAFKWCLFPGRFMKAKWRFYLYMNIEINIVHLHAFLSCLQDVNGRQTKCFVIIMLYQMQSYFIFENYFYFPSCSCKITFSDLLSLFMFFQNCLCNETLFRNSFFMFNLAMLNHYFRVTANTKCCSCGLTC